MVSFNENNTSSTTNNHKDNSDECFYNLFQF
jgi:hypothetical protein